MEEIPLNETKHARVGSAEIASFIRQDIKSGKLHTKDRLPPERVLANSYHVARGTVREALNRLAQESLVEVRAGSGTYVTFDHLAPTEQIIRDARPLELVDARMAFEPQICRLAAKYADKNQLKEMAGLLVTMESSVEDPETFSVADTAFHQLLADSTQNSLLIWIASQSVAVRNQKPWSNMRKVTLNRDTIALCNTQHRAIYQSILMRNAEAAAGNMNVHLESARSALLANAAV